MTLNLTDSQFKQISTLVYSKSGINLHAGKKELVRARLGKRLRAVGCRGFDEYYDFLTKDEGGGELVRMLDAITTNKTSFFREKAHYDFLEKTIFPAIAPNRRGRANIRCWCAGCSSGEEPYTLAICASEYFRAYPHVDFRILGTDISTEILDIAGKGVYPEAKVQDMSVVLLRRYFQKGYGKHEGYYRAKDSLKKMVTFKNHNLMEPCVFAEPFGLILCRNVMIYFDKETQTALVRRFYNCLTGGGYLFVGHAESLTGIEHSFTYIQPTIYRK